MSHHAAPDPSSNPQSLIERLSLRSPRSRFLTAEFEAHLRQLEKQLLRPPITISFINEISSSQNNDGCRFGAALISPDEECGPDRVPCPPTPRDRGQHFPEWTDIQCISLLIDASASQRAQRCECHAMS
jgi:hypothetical protein